jgi:hypothetical protein
MTRDFMNAYLEAAGGDLQKAFVMVCHDRAVDEAELSHEKQGGFYRRGSNVRVKPVRRVPDDIITDDWIRTGVEDE